MRNRTTLIIIIVVLLFALVGGGYFLFMGKSSKPAVVTSQLQDEVVEIISPDKLGLEVLLRNDKKAIKFTIARADGIESIDYQISYTKQINGEEVPEGLIGQIEVASTDSVGINYREFGTCSSGKCRYDNVISPVKLTLKIVKSNGKTYSSEKTIEL